MVLHELLELEELKYVGKQVPQKTLHVLMETEPNTDHSIFVAFAPKENPQIALAVFIENGYWGARWAAPIASP